MKRTKSAVKRVDVAERNRKRNISAKSAARTAMKKLLTLAAVAETDATSLQAALGKAYGLLDRAVLKGILHKNTAARYKSRLGLAASKVKTPVAA